MPVFLDSGSTMTLLPPNLTQAIAADFGVQGPDVNGFFRVDCGLTTMNGTIDFAFAGVTVKVPYKELIREVAGLTPACFLGITPSNSFTLLGDTFLRSAYTVFDLETNTIWLSQAANCGSTPAALSKASDLAGVVGVCGKQASPATGSTNGTGSSIPGFGSGSGSAGGTANGGQATGSAGTRAIESNGLGLIIGTMWAVAALATVGNLL